MSVLYTEPFSLLKNCLTSTWLKPFKGTYFSCPPAAAAGALSSFFPMAGAGAGVAFCAAALVAHTLTGGAEVGAGETPGLEGAAEAAGAGDAFEDRGCGVRDAEGRGRAQAPLFVLLSVCVCCVC